MHAHNLRSSDRFRQAVHHPTLEGMCPVRGDDGVLLSNEFHGKGNVLIGGGDHETLTHLGKLGGHVKGDLALDGNTLASIFGIESTRKRNDVGLGSTVLRQERERVHGRSRRHVDNGTATTLNHTINHHVGHPSGGVDVHLNQIANLLIGKLMEEAGVAVRNTDVVDKNAHVQISNGSRNSALSLLVKVGIVAHHVLDLHTIVSLGIDLLLEVGKLGLRPTDEDDAHSLLGKAEGIGLADTVRSARNNSPLAQLLQILARAEEGAVNGSEGLNAKLAFEEVKKML